MSIYSPIDYAHGMLYIRVNIKNERMDTMQFTNNDWTDFLLNEIEASDELAEIMASAKDAGYTLE